MSVRTKSQRTLLSGQVDGTAATILDAEKASNYVRVINPALPGGNNLWVTYDGTDPVVGQIGVPIFPGGTDTNDNHCPLGPIKIIADASSTYWCLEYA